MRPAFSIAIVQIVVVAAFFIAWQSLSVDKTLSIFLAFPSQLLSLSWLKDAPTWIPYFRHSTIEMVEAFALAAGGGIGWGIIFIEFDSLYKILEPYIVWGYSIPKILVFPIFIRLFGLGSNTVIAFACVSAFFVVVLGMVVGYKNIDKHLLEVAKSFGMNVPQRFIKIILPALVPPLFGTLRQAIILTIGGVLLGEIVLDFLGIGFIIDGLTYALRVTDLYAVVAIIALVTMFLNMTMLSVERRLNFWRS